MAAIIIPQDQLRIPEHLRGRLERPSLRVVAPPGSRPAAVPTTVLPLRAPRSGAPATGRVVRPGSAVRSSTVARPRAAARLAPEPLDVRPRRSGGARLVVVACLAVVALTGVTALAVGGPAPAPASVAAPAATPAATPVASQVGDVWVVQPGDSLWSIAAAVAPDADLRPVVDELARRTGGGSLQPGQRIGVEGLVP